MRTVRRGHAAARNLPFPTPSRHGLRRRRLATTAIAQVIRTAAARTSRRSVRSRLTTTIAAIRHSAPTIRPRARTQSREHIPHRAAAIQLRPDPTPHRRIPPPAAVIAAVEVAAAVTAVAEAVVIAAVVAEVVAIAVEVVAVPIAMEVAEVHTPVEARALTADTNLVLKFKARLANPDGPFAFLLPAD